MSPMRLVNLLVTALQLQSRGAWSPRVAHNHETAGSNPVSATKCGYNVSGSLSRCHRECASSILAAR